MNSRFIINGKALIAEVFSGRDVYRFWDSRQLNRVLPILFALGLGVFLAIFVDRENWYFAIALILLVPAATLLIRYPFVAILIWLLIFPFFVETPTSAERYVYWMLHRALIPATLILVLLTQQVGLRKWKQSLHPGPAELAMVTFLILVLLNIFLFSPDTQVSIFHLYDHIFVPFCMYWLVRLTAQKEKDLKLLLWVALLTALFQGVIGLVAWFSPQILPTQWLGRQGSRTTGTLGNPAVYSSTLIFLALLLFQQATQTGSGKIRAILLSVFVLSFFGIFFTFSRGSWLAGAVVLLGLILLYPKVTLRLMFVVAVIAFILGTTLLAREVSWASRRLNTENTAEGRIILFYTGLRMIEEKPLFGWGYGNYDSYDNQFKTAIGDIVVRTDNTSHNTYLTIMAEMGIIPFLIYIFPLVYWFVQSFKAWRWLPQGGFWSRRLLVIFWLVIAAHIAVSSFMDMIRFHEFGTTIWWMTLGFIASMVYPHLYKKQSGNIYSLKPGNSEQVVS